MAGNKAPQARRVQRVIPQQKGLVVEMEYYREQQALEEARYVSNYLQWSALGNFMDNQARPVDWYNLQFWLYFAESLVAIEEIKEEPELRVEFGEIISEGFKALYTSGRRFTESGNTILRMSPMDIEMVRSALKIGDAYKEGLDDKTLKGVARYVNKHINNGQ
jgi:hypothetical protein